MSLIVQKYGGSSLKTAREVHSVADRIQSLHSHGLSIVVVVSAMGNTTNELIDLAFQVSPRPLQRELDMLLTTGERVSMSLLSMALNDRSVPAISFTGSQAGVITNESHNNAQIVEIKPLRVKQALEQKKVVVLAGFQGVTQESKEVTTLGRGGSDTTAVAMAAHFSADRCEILKDVDGVYSADPKIVKTARLIPMMSYQHLSEMTFWGSKVLHHRAADLALQLKVPLYVGPTHTKGTGTLIKGEATMYENSNISSINSHTFVRLIRVKNSNLDQALIAFTQILANKNFSLPQIIDARFENSDTLLLITGPKENILPLMETLLGQTTLEIVSNHLSSVTVTGLGFSATPSIQRLTHWLTLKGVALHSIISSPMSCTFVINENDRENAIKILHEFMQ
ncbi:MAG: aspartate kinase [Pseudomonadota bacterium]|nr:aspartate kinase [Pseudomonadota bacterium]